MFSCIKHSVVGPSSQRFVLHNLFSKVCFITRNFTLFSRSKHVCINKTLSSNYIYLNSIKCFNTSPASFKKLNDNYISSLDNTDEEIEEDIEYDEIVKRTLRLPEMGHQVFIVQPYIKWGQLKKKNTTPELQLAESEALINTLPNWKVICSKIVPLLSFRSPKIFGKGNLALLKEQVSSNKNITAVFISMNILSPVQQEIMEEEFNVPVFDRYTIVVQIFKMHAVTKAAKIQVAMGEIPYMWSRLRYDKTGMSDKMGGGATIGGPGETYLEIKKRLLQDKERKLKMQLTKLKAQRELMRSNRHRLGIPTVAVVGYTNAGKTSLIKALTKEEKMQPKDILFATLDVTVHAGYMPSGLKVLFVDTVGFLSDIPTNLIQSFIATLEDALKSDLIIHVQDISHPDLKAQNDHVLKTLRSIDVPENLLETMITVANKVDLAPVPLTTDSNIFPVSCTLGYGLEALKRTVEKSIIEATGQLLIKIRVPNGGPELAWLHKEATVVQVAADDSNKQFVFVDTIITDTNLKIFKHMFITLQVKRSKG